MSDSSSYSDGDNSGAAPTLVQQAHARTTAWPTGARVAWWVLLLPVALALFSGARLQGWPRRVGLGVAAVLALMVVSSAFSSSPSPKPAVAQLTTAGQA